MSLTPDQRARYARHLTLPEVGPEGQRRLLQGRVLVVGAGGLGCPALLYLAAAGVGTIGIVDDDVVEASNLQRQILYGESDSGNSKLEGAQRRLMQLNPDAQLEPHRIRLTSANAMEIMSAYDVVIDGTDNFATRYLTNDACVLLGKPNVYGSVAGFCGQASVFWPAGPSGGPCYRCLFPEPPPPGSVPTCAEGGVLGILPGVIGLLQATETIKILLYGSDSSKGELLTGRLLLYDAMRMEFRTIRVRRNSDCPVCGDNPAIRELIDYEQFCNGSRGDSASGTFCGGEIMKEISVQDLKSRLDAGETPLVIDVRNEDEHAHGAIPGARLIPLGELAHRIDELEAFRDQEIIVHCQMGGRSARACEILKRQGFADPINVTGGYAAWRQLR